MGKAGDQLRQKLQLRIRQPVDHRFFFSDEDIKSILSREAIHAVIADTISDDFDSSVTTSTVFRNAQKVFGILLWNHKEQFITDFIEHGALDHGLPFEEARLMNITPAFGSLFAGNWQWHFLPCVLSFDMRQHYRFFRPETIFPYIEEQILGEGGFGDVFLTSVDASQQTYTTSTDPNNRGDVPSVNIVKRQIGETKVSKSVVLIARKRISVRMGQSKESKENMVRNEMKCLRILGHLKHRNIIQMLGCYTYRDEQNILFPYIEMDLEAFMRSPYRSEGFMNDENFIFALQGLSSALCHVHNLRLDFNGLNIERVGYHHDFRPRNILVDHETFLLADFGLSRVKSVDDGSRTTWKAGSSDFLAPECMNMKFQHQEVGRAIDIWAFGCMVVEILTYMKLGAEGIKRFRHLRLSPGPHPRIEDQCFHNGREVKPAIHDWLRVLLTDPKPLASQDLIDLTKSMLVFSSEQRAVCSEICQQLRQISARTCVETTLGLMDALIDRMSSISEVPNEVPVMMMELWFERERLKVWSAAFGLASEGSSEVKFRQEKFDDQALESIKNVHREIAARLVLEQKRMLQDPELRSIEEPVFVGVPVAESVRNSFQKLWQMLSPENRNRAQFLWTIGALDRQDVERMRASEIQASLARHAEYSEIAALASIKSLILQFEGNQACDRSSFLLAEKDVKIIRNLGLTMVGTYQESTKVFMDILRYDETWEGMKPEKRAERMQLIAEGLYTSEVLPELRIPRCIGFIPIDDAFGFLYPFPDNIDAPTTLFSLLGSKAGLEPPLESKMKLANDLALCVKELHTVGWLHRNLNSDNILFFHEAKVVENIEVNEPLVVGLTTARPDSDLWSSWGPGSRLSDYRHPQYTKGSRYRAIYDYYSLGIILLEIGLWRSVHSITLKWGQKKNPESVKATLIEKYVKQLKPCMGTAYFNAVLACLTVGKEHGDYNDVSKARIYFYDEVVEVLSKLSQSFA